MVTLELREPKNVSFSFSWKDSPSIQRLLDSISSILAEEYIMTARQNPDVFIKYGGSK